MDDPDVIAYLYPHPGEGFQDAANIIDAYRATPMHVPRQPVVSQRVARPGGQRRNVRNRDTTPEVAAPSSADDNNPNKTYAGIAIRFSAGAKSRVGVVIGSDDNADIKTKNTGGVSRFHAAITFDSSNRLVMKDLGSRNGCRVIYGGCTTTKRRVCFTWLLRGPSILGPAQTTVIEISDLQFRVVVPARDTTSRAYLEQVAKFRKGTADREGLLQSLVLSQSVPDTPANRRAETPLSSSEPILLSRELGKGGFGTVSYNWNATTGDEYALKAPLEEHILQGSVNVETWRKEASILLRVSHEHIVTFFRYETVPHPQLSFEYVPGGSLDRYHQLSPFENAQILCQLLSALEYLHTLSPPIAHRDIKPANVLVEYRRPYDIRVKFGDFGLARAAYDMSTVCGTWFYAAPEILNKHSGMPARQSAPRDKYDAAVDIYSCGVTIGKLACGMPAYDRRYSGSGTVWARVVRSHFAKHAATNDLVRFLLDFMVVIKPEERKKASECLAAAMLVFGSIALQSGLSIPQDCQNQRQPDPVGSSGGTTIRQVPGHALSGQTLAPGVPGPSRLSMHPQQTAAATQQPITAIYHGQGSGGGPAVQRGGGQPSRPPPAREGRTQGDPRVGGAAPHAPPAHQGKRLRSGRQIPSVPALDRQESSISSSGSILLPPGKRSKRLEASH